MNVRWTPQLSSNLRLLARRAVGMWLDIFIASLIPVLIYWLLVAVGALADPNAGVYALTWATGILAFAYRVWCESQGRPSLGHNATKVEVIGAKNLATAAQRNAWILLMPIHDVVAFVVALGICIMVLFNRAHVGDIWARTAVIEREY